MATMQCRSTALWLLWMLVLLQACSSRATTARSLLGRRALLAQDTSVTTAAACSQSSDKLLTNGYFVPDNLPDMNNALIMAAMSNDVYPWAKQYGHQLLDVVDGLDKQQTAKFQAMFIKKYTNLGATTIQFVDFYTGSIQGAAGHAVVLGTQQDVFVVFRGTADVGQAMITGIFETRPWTVFNKPLEILYPAHASMSGLFPKVLVAVKRAVAATNNPSGATVYLTGHSLGGASACLGALLLKEQGYNIGGVWAFDPYKIGHTCATDEDCWVSVYDQHLKDVTWMYWNNQDPIPQLIDAHFGSLKSMNTSRWGHVPRDQNWVRVVGDKCLPASGTPLAEPCPPEIDAADGVADGVCPSPFGDHLPWNILKRIASCALLQNPVLPPGNARIAASKDAHGAAVPKESLRLEGCSRSSVWTALLGLPVPGK